MGISDSMCNESHQSTTLFSRHSKSVKNAENSTYVESTSSISRNSWYAFPELTESTKKFLQFSTFEECQLIRDVLYSPGGCSHVPKKMRGDFCCKSDWGSRPFFSKMLVRMKSGWKGVSYENGFRFKHLHGMKFTTQVDLY